MLATAGGDSVPQGRTVGQTKKVLRMEQLGQEQSMKCYCGTIIYWPLIQDQFGADKEAGVGLAESRRDDG